MASLVNVERIVEEVLFRNFAKFRNTNFFFEVLKDVVPKRVLGIPTGLDKKIEEAKHLVEQGDEFQDALYKTGLINKEGYILLKNAIATGSIREVFEERLNTQKVIRDQTVKAVSALLFPILALFASLFVIYVAIYKLYAQVKLVVKLQGLFYQVLDYFYQDPMRYYIFVGIVVSLLLLIYIFRYKVPMIKDILIQIEKLKFYTYLKVGLKAGLHLHTLFKEYEGFFKPTIDKVLKDAERGEDLVSSFVKEFSVFLTPIEKANLVSSLNSSDRNALAQAFKDAYDEAFLEFQKKFDALSKAITLFIILLVSSIIYIVFVKIYLQVYSTVNGNLNA